MQINTPKTLRSGIGVFCESGIGVVVMEWQWSVHSGVALKCTLGVALECDTGRSAINDVPAFFPPLGVASVARSLQHDHKGRCR